MQPDVAESRRGQKRPWEGRSNLNESGGSEVTFRSDRSKRLSTLVLLVVTCLAIGLTSCTVPLSEQLAGRKIAVASPASGVDLAELKFSSDKKYETAKGVPLEGDPLVCVSGTAYRVNEGESKPNRIRVKAGEEVAVTSVVAWTNTGFRKVCGSFVWFTPEKDATYIVVSERIGGKGASALWTGMAFQTCEVSVYREASAGVTLVSTRKVGAEACRVPDL